MATKTGEVNYLQKGEQGDIGPLVYPAGEYASGVNYTRTALSAPMVLCEGQYYVLNKVGTFKGINPKTDYAANGSKATWALMDKVQYAFFDVLMANFAKLDSAVFYDGCMFSQEGVDADGNKTTDYRKFGMEEFTPNLLLNFLIGKAVFNDAEVRGKFSTSLGGTRIEIDPKSNSIKMYNQYDNVVGDISFLEEEWGGSHIYYPRIRLRRYLDNRIINETIIGDRNVQFLVDTGSVSYSCILDPIYGLTFYQGMTPMKKYPAS